MDVEEVVIDPVCQMKIRPSEAAASIEYEVTTYYFCSPACAESFRATPEVYL